MEKLKWDCITGPVKMSPGRAKLEQNHAVPGVSLAAPSFFHNNAQHRRHLGQAESVTKLPPAEPNQRTRSGNVRNEVMRRTFQTVEPFSLSNAPISLQQVAREHDSTQKRHHEKHGTVFAVNKAQWDSAHCGAAAAHQVGKFPFPTKPAPFFEPVTFPGRGH